jgi:hypothetical protein
MMRRFMPFLALLFALVAPQPAPGANAVLAEQFDRLSKLIKPTAAESSWSSIPWMADLNEARRKAAAEGKPLFVWTMSGEPLGTC